MRTGYRDLYSMQHGQMAAGFGRLLPAAVFLEQQSHRGARICIAVAHWDPRSYYDVGL